MWLMRHSRAGLTTHQALPPGTVLVQRLIKQCDSVVSHLKEVSGGALVVARMELYFKVDTSSRVWLLCCNSLRLDRSAATLQRWSLLQRQPSSSPSSLKAGA
ncbi:uncharacterized protein HaLaN_22632 [Haematococcus lacustris]|uniref:Uncharacterized protein n=1 Tax=Haematococcus lacustris TaxID=44745 RepID=A0A6A0A167_HAELA|nr:uncharacterized protein HaLaN_22632 [Haematococcus lacustris]